MASSSQRIRGAPIHVLLKAVVGLYIVAAALLPLSHHDLACHFKSPTHCTTCIIGASGETTDDCGTLTRAVFAYTGLAVGPAIPAPVSVVDDGTSGRAPPSRG